MNHHLDKDVEGRPAPQEGVGGEGDVTRQPTPSILQENASVEIPDKVLVDNTKNTKGKGKGKGKKGANKTPEDLGKAPGKEIKSGTGSSMALQKIKNQINCGGCGNNMRYSDKITVVPVEGKKVPKGIDGQYRFESPGAPKGEMIGVLCDTCVYAINNYSKKIDGSPGIDITSIIAVGKDGEPRNVRVADL